MRSNYLRRYLPILVTSLLALVYSSAWACGSVSDTHSPATQLTTVANEHPADPRSDRDVATFAAWMNDVCAGLPSASAAIGAQRATDLLHQAAADDRYWQPYRDILIRAGILDPSAAQIEQLLRDIVAFAADPRTSPTAGIQEWLDELAPGQRLQLTNAGANDLLAMGTVLATRHALVLRVGLVDGQLVVQPVNRSTLAALHAEQAVDLADLVRRVAIDPTLLALTPQLAADAGFGRGLYFDHRDSRTNPRDIVTPERFEQHYQQHPLRSAVAHVDDFAQLLLAEAVAGIARLDDSALVGRYLGLQLAAQLQQQQDLVQVDALFRGVTPGPDWTRVMAGSSFSFELPPGWQIIPGRGIDSFVGSVTGDGIALTFDFGRYGSAPSGTLYRYEDIGGFQARLVRSAPTPGPFGSTSVTGSVGMYVTGLGDSFTSLRIASASGQSLTEAQIALVLGIFRTLQLADGR